MEQVKIGIIGGSGLYDMAEVTDRKEVTLETPFGPPSGPYVLGTLWVFHTDADEMGRGHMNGYQDAELTYSRNGVAWR